MTDLERAQAAYAAAITNARTAEHGFRAKAKESLKRAATEVIRCEVDEMKKRARKRMAA